MAPLVARFVEAEMMDGKQMEEIIERVFAAHDVGETMTPEQAYLLAADFRREFEAEGATQEQLMYFAVGTVDRLHGHGMTREETARAVQAFCDGFKVQVGERDEAGNRKVTDLKVD